MLGANLYCPKYTCSTTSRISWSVDPRMVLTKGCSGAVCCGWEHLHVCHCHSLFHIAVTLWKRWSNRKSPHSCCWMVFQPRWSLLSSSRNSWPQRAHSATLFKCPIIRATTFACSLKAAKLPYCRVTISSILQWWMIKCYDNSSSKLTM